MNLYEIYFILKWHPPLNVDDKTRDYPTVELPDVEWTKFKTPLWEKWHSQITDTGGRTRETAHTAQRTAGGVQTAQRRKKDG